MSKSSIMPLVAQSHLVWKRYLQECLAGHAITPKQRHLLRALARREFLYPADIARILFCDRPTARVVVRNLEKRGWAKRGPDPDDARRTRVGITKAGREKLAAVTRALQAAGAAGFDPTGGLGPDDIIRLERLLRKLYDHLSQLPEAPRPRKKG